MAAGALQLQILLVLLILILLFISGATTDSVSRSDSSLSPAFAPSPEQYSYDAQLYAPPVFANILHALGFEELSSTTASANLSTGAPITIFALPDSSILTCRSCVLRLLLHEHSVPGLYPLEFLRRIELAIRFAEEPPASVPVGLCTDAGDVGMVLLFPFPLVGAAAGEAAGAAPFPVLNSNVSLELWAESGECISGIWDWDSTGPACQRRFNFRVMLFGRSLIAAEIVITPPESLAVRFATGQGMLCWVMVLLELKVRLYGFAVVFPDGSLWASKANAPAMPLPEGLTPKATHPPSLTGFAAKKKENEELAAV
ncbi:unnamed protein product [Cuscuta campestris]|uniref:FAS1 domain-containing protein n=1 Tax=Cuscuta campestris TaxID=132261 RepID=A0A484NLS1_9ASTE|nr:unnamed protein product [Cuscuta campestris]